MTHEMKLQAKYFDLIKQGKKIYEIRLNDEKRQLIQVGDVIIFKKEPELSETLNVVVNDLIYFKAFEQMAKSLPLEKVGFETETISEVVDIYHQFYTPENEIKYGVVAMKIVK